MLSYFEPVKRVKDWSDVTRFGRFNNGMCTRVLNLLVGQLKFKEFIVKRIAAMKFRVHNKSGNIGCSFGTEVRTDTITLTNMIVA